MSDMTPATPQDPTIYVLRPAPPARAFLISAVLIVFGAILVVAAYANGWPGWVFALCLLVLIAGLALFAVAVLAMLRMRVHAELTDVGYLFKTPAGVSQGSWGDVTKVTTSETGNRISFIGRDDSVQNVLSPVGSEDKVMRALVQDLTARLRNR